MNGFKVFCVGIPCYNFMRILLKLYRCLGCGLKMSILPIYNPQIILLPFSQVELCQFYGQIEWIQGILC